jgi:hypothetical protein
MLLDIVCDGIGPAERPSGGGFDTVGMGDGAGSRC